MSERPSGPGLRARTRRLAFGLSTLLGRPRGVFIPYRYAPTLEPRAYPALEALFRAAEPSCRAVLEAVDGHAGDLRAITADRGGASRARFDQDWFPRLDAAATYAIVRRERPGRIVEIGSGHSTRFMARAVADGALGTALHAIDPAPRTALPAGPTHHASVLSACDPGLLALGPGDILFVDSSHIAVPGSDVDTIVADVLPRLAAGTLVHLHDILLPDPYPAEWAWRGYNEATVVAALLAGAGWEIVFSSHWVATRRPDWIAGGVVGRLPSQPGARNTSLWLRKRPGAPA